MEPLYSHFSKRYFFLTFFCFIVFFIFRFPANGQGGVSPEVLSYDFGEYTPTISNANVTASNLTEGSGISFYDCSGNFVAAGGFDQRNETDAVNDGDYWEFSVTPNAGYSITIDYFEVNHRASNHLWSNEPVNTLGTIHWKIGSGAWIPSGLVAQVQHSVTPFCTSNSSRRPHFPNFTSTETVTFRMIRWIYDDGNGPYNRETRNGKAWIEGFTTLLPLPVELTKFNAFKNDGAVVLKWETESEVENDFFQIEHSMDGKAFNVLSKIAGAGTTDMAQAYQFIHETPYAGNNYYRLKQVDLDGSFEYSGVITMNMWRDGVKIYPNPISDYLYVEADGGLFGQIVIHDNMGRVAKVFDGVMPMDYSFDVSDLEPGIYHVQLPQMEGGGLVRRRIVKN